jgi:hypothetical protein
MLLLAALCALPYCSALCHFFGPVWIWEGGTMRERAGGTSLVVSCVSCVPLLGGRWIRGWGWLDGLEWRFWAWWARNWFMSLLNLYVSSIDLSKCVWRHLAARLMRLSGWKGVKRPISPCRLKNIGGANSILWFRLEKGGDKMKRCQKMKWRQRACLGSMERKHDTALLCGNVGLRRGDTREGKGRRRW